MKSKKSNANRNGKGHVQAVLAKAAATKKLAQAAKQHLKSVKAEHKEARKAFKQAKKAAKRARREAKAALRMVNGKATKNPKTVRNRPARTTARTASPMETLTTLLPVPTPATPTDTLAV
jgi:hypothetical protein